MTREEFWQQVYLQAITRLFDFRLSRESLSMAQLADEALEHYDARFPQHPPEPSTISEHKL